MAEREALDREIYALERIMETDAAALRSGKTSGTDRILLRLQIGLRGARRRRLLRRREALEA
jgi:hypothetical protein